MGEGSNGQTKKPSVGGGGYGYLIFSECVLTSIDLLLDFETYQGENVEIWVNNLIFTGQ